MIEHFNGCIYCFLCFVYCILLAVFIHQEERLVCKRLAWLSVWNELQMTACGLVDIIAILSSLALLNSKMVHVSGAVLSGIICWTMLCVTRQ